MSSWTNVATNYAVLLFTLKMENVNAFSHIKENCRPTSMSLQVRRRPLRRVSDATHHPGQYSLLTDWNPSWSGIE